MTEWTEQQEQQIIERAKAGDPEANYELSLWALRRGEEEPDEPRWNRLAAKCLVKAAQAGYAPAKEQMDALLHPDEPAPSQKKAPAPSRRTEPAEPVKLSDARRAARRAPAQQTTARRVPSRRQEPEDEFDDDSFDVNDPDWDDQEDEEEDAPLSRRARAGRASGARTGRASRRRARDEEDSGGGRASGPRWSEAQWRKMEIICVIVCAALLIFIAVMLFTSRRDGSGSGSAIPPAGQVAPAANVSGGEAPAEEYPDEATKAAIMAADLSIQPENEDYMPSATSATVSVGSVSLRMRKGPNTTYDQIGEIPDEEVVSVYAQKNDWYLVYYAGGENGPVYGWCNSQYLILNSGVPASSAPQATEDPAASAG